LKPEWWSSPLVQKEKYQEKPVEREEIIIIMQFFILVCNSQIANYRYSTEQIKNKVQPK
jgi:hypothetical protein